VAYNSGKEITMTKTCEIVRGTDKPVTASADTLDNLSVLLATLKPATVDPTTSTPAIKAAEYVKVKFAAIIAKDAKKAADKFVLHCDAETGANAKSGYDVTMTRKEVLTYADKLLVWAKSAPGLPPITFVKVDGRKSRAIKVEGEFDDNE
jgi:hypothetical protein